MKRLMEKTELGDYIFKDGEYACPNEIANKLGQLEDIEEQHGIDLIVFGKALQALTGVVYYKSCSGQIFEGFAGSLITTKRGVEGRDYVLFISDIADGFGELFKLKDYGKTWALTKEELL